MDDVRSASGGALRSKETELLGGRRSDHPRDVIPGPSAGDSLTAGDIDVPKEVANDELDDLFLDVTTAPPEKQDCSLAKTLREKKKHFRVFPGPTAADIQATLVQGRAPDVESYLPRSDVGALHTAIHGGA